LVLDMLEECNAPLIAWARPGMGTGSLCGQQQLSYMLKQMGHPCLSLYEFVGAPDGLARAWDFARAAAVCRRLRRARIGYLGHRVEGMTETTPHELALKRLLGPRVVGLDSQVFMQQVAAVPPASMVDEWEQVKGRVGCMAVDDAAGLASMQVKRAMEQAILQHGLSAVAVGCYPHLMGKVCLAASLLAEQGLPLACEGDVNGAVGMFILNQLGGQPVHNTDQLDPMPEDNAIVYAHCGAGAFCLANSEADVTLGPVRLMDQGLCCLFTARPGPVTLLNLVPTLSGYRLGVLYGQALETEMVFPGNPLKVRYAHDYRQVLDWIAGEGLGHHWMAAYGDLRRPLADLAAITGVEFRLLS
jgi:L-fucose isomerase-like protein